MNDAKIVNKTGSAVMITMFFFASSATIIPICLVQITADLSISLTQVGILNIISTAELFIALLCSCYITSRFGKIRVIRWSVLVVATGLLAIAFCQNFWHVLLVFIFIGFGSGLLEGLLTPIVEDLYPNEQGKKMNLVHAFWPIGVCATLLTAGELLSRGISWRYLFAGLALLTAGLVFLYGASKKLVLPPSRADFSHTLEIFSKRRFWMLGMALFFSGGAEGGFAFWTASYIQLKFEALPRAGGIGAACFAVGMVIGRFLTSKLAYKIKLKYLLLLFSSGSFILSLLFFLVEPNLNVLYGFMLATGFTIACLWPSLQSYSSSVINADPTMLMVYMACFGATGYSIATFFMGMIGDNWDLQHSFIIAPVFLACLILLLIFEGPLAMKSKGAF